MFAAEFSYSLGGIRILFAAEFSYSLGGIRILFAAEFSYSLGGIRILFLNFQNQEYSCSDVSFSLFLLSLLFLEPFSLFSTFLPRLIGSLRCLG